MNNKIITFVILSSLILGAIGSLFLTRVIIPKLATLPFLVRHNIAPAPGPLVINTTQQIRVADGTDTIAAIQRVTPWTVAILVKDSAGNVQAVGSGVLLTSDGLIATTKTAIANQTQLWAKAADGTVASATIAAADPSSDLVFIQAAFKNQASASFGSINDLQLGARAVVVSQSLGNGELSSRVTYIASKATTLPANTIFSSDAINRTIGISSALNPLAALPGQSLEGSAVASSDGSIVGVYSKSGIIIADSIQSALSSYFNNNKQIIRPAFGIHYEVITADAAAITGLHEGVKVTKPDAKTPAVNAGSAAQQSGIQEGDVIIKVNDTQIDATHPFESLIASAQPNSVLSFELLRGSTDMVETVIAKQK